MLHLTFNNAIEAADTERRMITGKIAPYGEVGYTSAGPVVFERGSIAIPDVTKIKLLMQHDSTKPVGRATYSSDDESGVYASFKISSSSRGQDALVLAQENLVSGLSVGVDVSAYLQDISVDVIVQESALDPGAMRARSPWASTARSARR